MTAPTHVAGAIATVSFLSLLVPTYHLSLAHLVLASITAMLPDIDNPRSFIGRIFFFISTPIDRKFGHRTVTHSFLATFILAALVYLALFLYTHSLLQPLPITFTVAVGYFSHIFFDSMTIQGVLAYYPARLWGVFPRRASWRIRTGTRVELLFFFAFLLGALVFLPLGQSGAVRAFNRVFLHGGVDLRLQEFAHKKEKASLGFTPEQVDSLLRVGAIDPKQAQELKAKWQDIQIQEEQFRQQQALDSTDE